MRDKIKILISPKNLEEAKIVIKGKADYIDCKNPDEGSLGANFPWIIKGMKDLIPKDSNQLLSATIGDFPNLPGSASLAALGAVVSGADIVKVGLKGPKNEEEGIKLMKNVVKAVKRYNKNALVVTAGYADKNRINFAPEVLSIPIIAAKSNSDIAMVDTFIKDGKGLFDFLDFETVKEFTEKAHDLNLKVALAGSLKLEDIKIIRKISPDIVGVRSLVCEGFDRNRGKIKLELINMLRMKLYKK